MAALLVLLLLQILLLVQQHIRLIGGNMKRDRTIDIAH